MNKRISAILLALFLFVFCACGKKETTNVSEASEVTLRFLSTLGDAKDAEITSGILSEYTAENSHITLYYSSVASSEAYKLSLPDSATYRKNAPDMVYAPLSAVSDMLGEEYVSIEEIRSHISDYGADTAPDAMLRSSDGTAYGISLRGEGKILAVNTDLVSDYTDLMKSANEISKSDISLFADNALDSELFFEYLMTVYTNSEITPDTPQKHWAGGFKLFSELVKIGAFAPSDADPAELFSNGKAVYAVLSESEAAALVGENYRCAAFFGGFEEGLFITRSAFSSPLKRQAVLSLAQRILAQSDSYSEGHIPADASGVFFSLESAYKLTPCEERYGAGCWDDVLTALTKGDEPAALLDTLMNKPVSDTDA